jgi:hypothetical protein
MTRLWSWRMHGIHWRVAAALNWPNSSTKLGLFLHRILLAGCIFGMSSKPADWGFPLRSSVPTPTCSGITSFRPHGSSPSFPSRCFTFWPRASQSSRCPFVFRRGEERLQSSYRKIARSVRSRRFSLKPCVLSQSRRQKQGRTHLKRVKRSRPLPLAAYLSLWRSLKPSGSTAQLFVAAHESVPGPTRKPRATAGAAAFWGKPAATATLCEGCS